MPRQRLDTFLVEKKIQPTRTRAQRVIARGLVLVNGMVADKPSLQVDENDEVLVKDSINYVSLGGYKLEKALKYFQIDLSGKIVLDIGSSTGGFTDCTLQHGAKLVYAVDVGTNQLHNSLRNDPRVVSFENCDIRTFDPGNLSYGKPDWILVDVSFISLKYIFPCLAGFLHPVGGIIILIKPQFEAGKQNIGKNGIVKNTQTHFTVLQKVIQEANDCGFFLVNITWAPLEKGKNIEYLAYLTRNPIPERVAIDLKKLVHLAFSEKECL